MSSWINSIGKFSVNQLNAELDTFDLTFDIKNLYKNVRLLHSH